MSRCGYVEDMEDQWAHIRWRGAVKSAIRGKRGQTFLKELLRTLDAMPEKKLIAGYVEADGGVCALGSVLKQRNVDTSKIQEAFEDDGYVDEAWLTDELSGHLNIPDALVREIEYVNDDAWCLEGKVTEEKRFEIVRRWVIRKIKCPIFGI